MSSFQIKLGVVGLSIVFAVSLAGCGESSNKSGPSVNEIEQYIQENPEKLATPEDSPASEADEFAAGESDEE